MYEWIHGRPPLVLRERDLERWPGTVPEARRDDDRFACVREFDGSPILMLREPQLTTVIPLELGGAMLVTAVFCDDDAALTAHLELVPVTGWEPLPERFHAADERYVLFDGSLSASEIRDPSMRERIVAECGGVVSIALTPGDYDVETLGPWTPDDRTELWLTRLVRSM